MGEFERMMSESAIEVARRVKNLSHEEHQKRIEALIRAYEKRSKERRLDIASSALAR